jgi:hypothetical protein
MIDYSRITSAWRIRAAHYQYVRGLAETTQDGGRDRDEETDNPES